MCMVQDKLVCMVQEAEECVTGIRTMGHLECECVCYPSLNVNVAEQILH